MEQRPEDVVATANSHVEYLGNRVGTYSQFLPLSSSSVVRVGLFPRLSDVDDFPLLFSNNTHY